LTSFCAVCRTPEYADSYARQIPRFRHCSSAWLRHDDCHQKLIGGLRHFVESRLLLSRCWILCNSHSSCLQLHFACISTSTSFLFQNKSWGPWERLLNSLVIGGLIMQQRDSSKHSDVGPSRYLHVSMRQ
jgi:hypothetical protein